MLPNKDGGIMWEMYLQHVFSLLLLVLPNEEPFSRSQCFHQINCMGHSYLEYNECWLILQFIFNSVEKLN